MKYFTKTLFTLLLFALISNQSNAQHFTPVYTGAAYLPMTFWVTTATIDGVDLEAGDEIAVFNIEIATGNEICVGAVVLIAPIDPYINFVTSTDEAGEPQNGFIPGSEIIYRFWDNSESKEIVLINPTYDPLSDLVFTSQGDAYIDPMDGASVNIWDGSAGDNDWGNAGNWDTGIATKAGADVIIPSDLTTYPTLSVDDECNNLTIQASSTGVGSLKDEGFLTVNGKATVETFLANSAGIGNFYIHLIGPTVNEQNFTGTGTGAYLEAFNIVNGSTYAYKWDETVPLGDAAWVSLSSLTDEIRTGEGIALSTTDDTDHTLSLTGDLITGTVSSPGLTYSNNHYEMISNPYPSAIDFDLMAGANPGVIESKYWIWDPTLAPAGNYVTRAAGSGGTKDIQVGQGFFVETKPGGGVVNFTNSVRTHSTVAFRDYASNTLTINVLNENSKDCDYLYIRFDENASFNYDQEIEAVKWNSMNEDATMIRSLAADNTELAINALPFQSLNNELVSVPVIFHCGYEGDYTFSFLGIDSFENDTEIWLQDMLISGDWININNNPEYTFPASPNDIDDRFVIHFAGPTGINPTTEASDITIYAHKQNAYIVNNGNETIQKVFVYDLIGRLVNEKTINSTGVNKIPISGKAGYYIVKVITENNIYSDKVFTSY